VQPVCTHVIFLIIASHNFLSVLITFRNSFYSVHSTSRCYPKFALVSTLLLYLSTSMLWPKSAITTIWSLSLSVLQSCLFQLSVETHMARRKKRLASMTSKFLSVIDVRFVNWKYYPPLVLPVLDVQLRFACDHSIRCFCCCAVRTVPSHVRKCAVPPNHLGSEISFSPHSRSCNFPKYWKSTKTRGSNLN